MQPTESQPGPPEPQRRRYQYSLRTLLVAVMLVAALFSMRFYTGWLVAGAAFSAVFVGGVAGAAVAKTGWGFVRGAACGAAVSLMPILGTTVYCFRQDYASGAETPDPRAAAKLHSAEEVLEAVQLLAPAARPIPGDSNIGELLSGDYREDFTGLEGSDLYLFPDKTYLYLDWADIWPRTIWDKGTWAYQQGLIMLHTDGPKQDDFHWPEKAYLPLTALLSETFAPSNKKKYTLLVGAGRGVQSLLNFAKRYKQAEYTERWVLIGALDKSTPIPADQAGAIKEKLYAECTERSPGWLRWQLIGRRYAMASGIMSVMLVALFILLRISRQPVPAPDDERPQSLQERGGD
jgi:hypothetical protein